MHKVDTLFAAIVATPSDDTPRLEWANQVGGERGEFVRIQCALAQTTLARAERRRLIARERELLRAHATPWGNIEGIATPRFRRGFAEAVEITLADLTAHANELVVRAPLLNAIHLRDMPGRINAIDKWPPDYLWHNTEKLLTTAFKAFPPRQISMINAEPAAEWHDSDGGNLHAMGDEFVAWIAGTPALQELTSLTVRNGYVTVAINEYLSGLDRLDEFNLDGHHLRAADILALLRSVPSITRLAIRYGDEPFDPRELRAFLAAPETARLRALDLRGHELSNDDITLVASLPLERLAFHSSRISTRALDALLANGTLRDFAFSGSLDEPQLRKLSGARFVNNLRRLELSGMPLVASELELLLALPTLDYLCISQRHGENSAAALEAVIPEVVVRRMWRTTRDAS